MDKKLESSPVERYMGDGVDGKLKTSQQWALAAKRAYCVLGCIKQRLASQWREVTATLCTALVCPHLKHCVKF